MTVERRSGADRRSNWRSATSDFIWMRRADATAFLREWRSIAEHYTMQRQRVAAKAVEDCVDAIELILLRMGDDH